MSLKRIIFSAVVAGCVVISASAGSPDPAKTQKLTFEKNIVTPSLKASQRNSQQKKSKGMLDYFVKEGLEAELTRDGEVVVVTIPVSDVFTPNTHTTIYNAEKIFDKFSQALKIGDQYRLVIAVYADDTGDNTYSKRLTDGRVEALKSLINNTAAMNGVSKPNVNFYSMGNGQPKYPNNTILNRAKNRRIEIYIVPEGE